MKRRRHLCRTAASSLLELVELRRLCVCRLEVGEAPAGHVSDMSRTCPGPAGRRARDALAEVVGLVVLAAEDPAPDQPHLGIDRVEDLASERLVVSKD